MTYTEEELQAILTVEKYKLQCVIDSLQGELKETQAKYQEVLETCLDYKNELKKANKYCDTLLHQKNLALQRLNKTNGVRI